MVRKLDIEGHRGCRGLLPENTLPAFKKAIDIGVTTLEMDLAITSDSVVIVSHEPFFNYEISTHPEGDSVTSNNHLQFNIYQMTFEEVQKWDVGMKLHPRFPEQEKIEVTKPSLEEVFTFAEAYAKEKGIDPLYYNIEIKSSPKGDNLYHPEVGRFADLVMEVVMRNGLEERVILQSFDLRALRYMDETYPEIATALLISNEKSISDNIAELGFKPDIYSPSFDLIDQVVLDYCSAEDIKLIPWTVNEEEDIRSIINKGVYGIISDYPDRVVKIWNELNQ
ncbi:MAG: glycerophosphodiester phosphodiesterase [Saprospiraceae bacterium]|nr:glycerophosphodiester phosphodiesterase [Saprospiraceae bacterium]